MHVQIHTDDILQMAKEHHAHLLHEITLSRSLHSKNHGKTKRQTAPISTIVWNILRAIKLRWQQALPHRKLTPVERDVA